MYPLRTKKILFGLFYRNIGKEEEYIFVSNNIKRHITKIKKDLILIIIIITTTIIKRIKIII